jgi:prepilin-type N-terminal cleavage/methylation domain-containing protein
MYNHDVIKQRNKDMHCIRKRGFTLAEVLITLAIIGVVAAVTIPVVMRNIQKQELKVQFKKAYSTITQAVAKTYADLGYQAGCYAYRDSSDVAHFNNTDCASVFWPQFFKNLKVIKYCSNNSFTKGCIPEYLGRDGIYQDQQTAQEGDPDYDPDYGVNAIKNCPAWSTSRLNAAAAYVLADGLIFSFSYNCCSATDPVFAIDINGKKPPNRLGYDVFALMFNAQDELGKNIKLQEGYCFTPDKGGLSTTQMLKEAMTK